MEGVTIAPVSKNTNPAAVRIRNDLRNGDLDRIVAHHATIYEREYGLDPTFAEGVAATVSSAGARGFPNDRERLWIVEADGQHAGSIAITDEGERRAALRWVLLDRELRGGGLGRRLVGEAMEFAEETGFDMVFLDTFSELRTAAHLYRAHGFELLGEDTKPRWGRDSISYQHYEVTFQRRAQLRSSRSAGDSASPFSVSA